MKRKFRAWMMAILAGAFAGSAPLYAQGAKVSSPAERLADALQSGEWDGFAGARPRASINLQPLNPKKHAA
jgi:hypothetical protein